MLPLTPEQQLIVNETVELYKRAQEKRSELVGLISRLDVPHPTRQLLLETLREYRETIDECVPEKVRRLAHERKDEIIVYGSLS